MTKYVVTLPARVEEETCRHRNRRILPEAEKALAEADWGINGAVDTNPVPIKRLESRLFVTDLNGLFERPTHQFIINNS